MQIATTLPLWTEIASLIPAASAIFAGVGLWINGNQALRSNAQARAEIVRNCLERFTDDEDMQNIFYSIEYSKFKFKHETFHGSTEEKQLDKLLMHFSAAALSWQIGLLSNQDLKPLKYFVRRILRDEEVIKYLNFISEYATNADLGEHPYIALSKMGGVFNT